MGDDRRCEPSDCTTKPTNCSGTKPRPNPVNRCSKTGLPINQVLSAQDTREVSAFKCQTPPCAYLHFFASAGFGKDLDLDGAGASAAKLTCQAYSVPKTRELLYKIAALTSTLFSRLGRFMAIFVRAWQSLFYLDFSSSVRGLLSILLWNRGPAAARLPPWLGIPRARNRCDA